MASTLAQLRTPQTGAVIRARLVAALTARGLPTADWVPTVSGGVENTTIDMVANVLAGILGERMASAVAGRFLDLAQGDLLTVLAKRFYQLDRLAPTSTIQSVSLTSAGSAPPYEFEPGDLWVMAPATGNRYTNLDHIVLPPATSSGLYFRFQAEKPGSQYADPLHMITTMVTAPAGVQCISAVPFGYLPPRLRGTSTGTMSGIDLGADHIAPPYFKSVRVRIEQTGDIGTATFSYSTDSGRTWTYAGALTPGNTSFFPLVSYRIEAPINDEQAGGAGLLFADGLTPGFIAGDIFTLILRDVILQQGADEETDDSLRAQCRGRWCSLALVPTAGLVELWAKLASREVRSVSVDADAGTPGGMTVTLAGAGGGASPTAQLDVEAYITDRLRGYRSVGASTFSASPSESVLVISAVTVGVTANGVVRVLASKLAAVQQAADVAWLKYLASVPIGGVVRFSKLEQLIMDAGAINLDQGAALNGNYCDLQLGHGQVAVAAADTSLSTSLTWQVL